MGEETPTRKRIALSKAERATAAGTELLALCQTVTEDGSINDDEVAALRQWLEDHRETEMPAKAFLLETVERILADGVVTQEERTELHKAIERVLPPELRKEAGAARRKQEAIEWERNQPIDEYDFMVAGVHYEGRGALVRQYARYKDDVYLVRDRANRYSRNAVEVRLENGAVIGYVPEDAAVHMAPVLDQHGRHVAWIKKILTGGRVPIPVVIAELYTGQEQQSPPAATAGQASAAESRPGSPLRIHETARGTGTGCLVALAIIILGFCASLCLAVQVAPSTGQPAQDDTAPPTSERGAGAIASPAPPPAPPDPCTKWVLNGYRLGMTQEAALAVRPASLKKSTMGLESGQRKAFVRGTLEGTLIFGADGKLVAWLQIPKSLDYTKIKADLVERLGPPSAETAPQPGAGLIKSLWNSKECGVSVTAVWDPTPFGAVTRIELRPYAGSSLD